MPQHTFFWHDYETFGRRPRSDRPAQFAGVRTDAELNEIAGDELQLYCQPAPDFLPDPGSCLLTGILPQTALQRGLPEHAFAAAIEAALATGGTVGVGYNSIRFDDEVTRFLFWRNLIDPYAREYKNGCSRWDLLDTVRCAYALKPEGIEWPKHEDGRASFRLEDLSRANGLAHEAAHDAMSDVRATIALARLVRKQQPRLWDFCLALRDKDAVWKQIGVGEPRPFLHVSGMYAAERGGVALVWPLGAHPVNRNELIVWDLAHDPTKLFELDAAAIRQRLFTRSEDLPEGITRLPIKTIHVNKSPVVIGNVKPYVADLERRFGFDFGAAQANAQKAAVHPPLPRDRWALVYERGEVPATDVDEDLYGGFLSDDDRRTLDRLRTLAPDALAAKRPAFADHRLDELLFRYRARNFPATLDGAEQTRWEAHRSARLHGGAGGALTLAAFFNQIDALSEQADERGRAILEALYDYAESVAPTHR